MSRNATAEPLSFRPWARDSTENSALKDVLARVNLERGHFRDITEASLQEEIAAEGALELSSSDDEEDEEVTADLKKNARETREELYTAKREMAEWVGAAQQEVLMSLDFISLLQSKHARSQATVTMSQLLKTHIPPASLGTDLWNPQRMPADPARQAQDALLANKVRLASLQHSADDLLAAATRLRDNVRKETVFWDEVLLVSEKSWNISRIPRTHLLGVHFGFNGCAREFVTRNVAALVADSDGSVALERGIGTKPKAVRAVIRRQGRVVGSSRLPSLPAVGETTLEARIRHARDSVFDEELHHEITREQRALTAVGVAMQGSTISFPASPDDLSQVELELLSLDEDNSLETDASYESDMLAQATLLAARLLLVQKHREAVNRKKELPPPMTENQDETQQSVPILRPLVLLHKHFSNLEQLNKYLSDVAALLRTPRISVECQPARIELSVSSEANTESLIGSLLRSLTSEGALWIIISDAVTLEYKIKIETSLANGLSSSYTLVLPGTKTITVATLDDASEGLDGILSLALGQALEEIAGDGWALDKREGILSRTGGGDANQIFWFAVETSAKRATMVSIGPQGRREVVWATGDSGEKRSLEDVWKSLVS